MSADESDVHHAIGIVNPYDQSVFIACNVENHTPIFKNAGISETVLNIGR